MTETTTEQIKTELGTMTAHPACLASGRYSSVEVTRTLTLPDEGVTINGVTYAGYVRLETSPGRAYVSVDCGMVTRKDQPLSWGTMTDKAREKLGAALQLQKEDLILLAGDAEWRRGQAEAEVRRIVRYEVLSAYRTAYRTAQGMGEGDTVDADAIARDVILSMTEEDLTNY